MLIQPISVAQAIQIRCRPHNSESGVYLLIVWKTQEIIYCEVQEGVYGNGVILGLWEFQDVEGDDNGTKLNYKVYEVLDGVAAIDFFNLKAYPINYQILEKIIRESEDSGMIGREINRGNIFVNSATEAPFKILK